MNLREKVLNLYTTGAVRNLVSRLESPSLMLNDGFLELHERGRYVCAVSIQHAVSEARELWQALAEREGCEG